MQLSVAIDFSLIEKKLDGKREKTIMRRKNWKLNCGNNKIREMLALMESELEGFGGALIAFNERPF